MEIRASYLLVGSRGPGAARRTRRVQRLAGRRPTSTGRRRSTRSSSPGASAACAKAVRCSTAAFRSDGSPTSGSIRTNVEDVLVTVEIDRSTADHQGHRRDPGDAGHHRDRLCAAAGWHPGERPARSRTPSRRRGSPRAAPPWSGSSSRRPSCWRAASLWPTDCRCWSRTRTSRRSRRRLHHLETFTATLAQGSDKVDATLGGAAKAAHQVEDTAADLQRLITDLRGLTAQGRPAGHGCERRP